MRLARLSEPAVALARAVAILGDDARARRAGTLAGLDAATTAKAIESLTAAGIIEALEPLAFVHPLIAAEIPAGDRAADHRRAAELLRGEGVGEDRLASHLLRASCAGDEVTVEVLGAAAARAILRGAPESAVVYLERALDEPPALARRAELLIELGEARDAAGGQSAAEPFTAALELLGDADRRAQVRWKLGRVLFARGPRGGWCPVRGSPRGGHRP
ncbi:MAG: hypothetical protein ACYC91_01060 [Solirubrobacteraceae bacterium]